MRAVRVVLSPMASEASSRNATLGGIKGDGALFATPDEVRRVWTAGMKHRVELRERGRSGEVMGAFRLASSSHPLSGEEDDEEEGDERLGGKGERLRVEQILMGLLGVV